MKKINRNFFKPFMFICVGLMAVMLMGAANPYDPPGAPGKPEMVDVGNDWCTIKFTPPTSDGGSPIQGYRIGWRYKGGTWNTTPADKLLPGYKVTITGLREGSEVEFRVSAVNKAGEGPPSDASGFFYIKD